MDAAPSTRRRRDAEILLWPGDVARRDALIADGTPRLLVLEVGTLPPELADDLEDWIWLPADERDVFARLRRLAARGTRDEIDADSIRVDDEGVAWIAGHRLALPTVEAAILRVLAERPEKICGRDDLARAAWGEGSQRRRSLDSRIFTLRRRLRPHGLVIVAVRGRGFVLGRAEPAAGGEP